MPIRLLFVISGILAGGIPGFRIGLVLLPSPDVALFCDVAWFCFVFFVWATRQMTHKMSLCMEFPMLVAIPFLSFLAVFCFVFVLFLCVCVPFCFVLCMMGLQLDCVLVHYQLFCGCCPNRQTCKQLQFSLIAAMERV